MKSISKFILSFLLLLLLNCSDSSKHDELVNDMKRRGYNHKSPLPTFRTSLTGEVNQCKSTVDFIMRCDKCHRNINIHWLKNIAPNIIKNIFK